MKNTVLLISTLTLFLLTFVLGIYFTDRVQNDKIAGVQVRVFPMDKTFILPKEVKKMIPVKDSVYKNIDVAKLERQLEKNDYIGNAEVYKDLNGHIKARIDQYQPIARVIGDTSYYIDSDGQTKALSKHYTENVILVFGKFNQQNKPKLINLIKAINADKELKAIVSEIHLGTQDVYLKTDQLTAAIHLDINNDVDGQLYKLKAIYTYLVKKHKTNQYQNLDLRYADQVVCK